LQRVLTLTMGTASKSLALVLVALSLTSLVTLPSVILAETQVTWTVQTVDEYSAAKSNGYCPIVVDSNNTPHIAYTGWSEGTERSWPWYFVMYSSWSSSGWSTQKVSNGTTYNLILDANNNPHILYSYYAPVYPSPTGLMYAVWTGSSWISQTVDPTGAGYGVIALDSAANQHVAYTDGTSIKYATSKGSNWETQTVATYEKGQVPFSLSFALDKNDTPYIMYSASSYADYSQPVGIRAINVTLATYQKSSWNIQPLSLPPPTGNYGNLVVDSKGILHSIFTQHYYVSSENKTTLNTILYATWNGTAWGMQTVVSDISSNSMSLSLDSHDYPHIMTSTGIYACWTGNKWDILDSDISPGTLYLALDSEGNPHIAYRKSSGSQVITNIMYAQVTETTQKPSPTKNTNASAILNQMLPMVIAVVVLAVVIVSILLYRKHRKTQADDIKT
jgi:hypothetical protein